MQTRKKGRCITSRICACLLAITVLFVPLAALSEAQNTAVLSDDTPGSGLARVYLASLGSPRSLDLQLSAAYHVADSSIVFPAGASIVLSVDNNNGQIKLTYAGQSWTLENEITLLRSTDNATLQIKQALGAGAYPADLNVRAVEKNNAYHLEAIANIRVEDYLPGVLSYAIISTAPAEALKAQAVVSRTYTLMAMQNNAENLYDLVDTGADQIYRGSPEANEACKAAVQETAGCVLTYNGLLAKTYYCLSNGGQTEASANAWADSEYPYLIVQDDPYDMASATAFAKTTVLDRDLRNGNIPASLLGFLKQKVQAVLAQNGVTVSDDSLSLLTLESVVLHTPKHSSPSKLYTKADFSLLVSINTNGENHQQQSVVVTADIFDELEALLDMSLQSNNNELWSVGAQETSILLRVGRYGHGVGMSQYGAMEMAKQGEDYQAILAFYYPGCQNIQYQLDNKTLREVLETTPTPSAPPTPAATPQPVATPAVAAIQSGIQATPAATPERSAPDPTPEIPALPASGSQVYYTYVTAEDFVNLRQAPNVHTDILTVALHGEKLRVLGVEDGWALVEYNGVQAYAVCNLLSLPVATHENRTIQTTPAPTDIPAPAPTPETPSFTVSAKVYAKSGTVNFREKPSKSSNVIMRLLPGTAVEVTGIGGDFCNVVYLGIPGYIMTEFLRFDQEPSTIVQAAAAPTAQPPLQPQPSVTEPVQQSSPCSQPQQTDMRNARVTTGGGTLNLRAAPNGSARVIARIPQCAIVQAMEYDNTWCAVRYDGMDGYAKKAFLTFGENYSAEVLSDRMSFALPEYSIGPAVVDTPSGSLNLRQIPCPYGTVLTLIPRGATVEVYTLQDGWALVAYKEYVGYVSETYLSIQQNDNQPVISSAAFSSTDAATQTPAA